MRLRTHRLVSFDQRHLAAIQYELVPEEADTEIVISSEMMHREPLPGDGSDPRLAVGFAGRVLQPAGTRRDGLRAILSYTTRSSGLILGCGMDHVLEDRLPRFRRRAVAETISLPSYSRCGASAAGRSACGSIWPTITPRVAMRPRSGRRWPGRWIAQCRAASLSSWSGRRPARQRFWDRADVEVEGAAPRLQQVIRWNLFQLLQATERAEGARRRARGLTGRSYEGHYFWDMEIYVLPFLIYTQPRMARNLLKFRYDMLDRARARARELGHRGATFPWRTINGDEASAYYAAGTAQYHINAAIAYALRKYVEVSGDEEFLRGFGAEILVETARFWYDLGFFSDRQDGKFCIHGVTGPGRVHRRRQQQRLHQPDGPRKPVVRRATRWRRCGATHRRRSPRSRAAPLEPGEPAEWRGAADHMYVPWDERTRINPQDDSFLDREVWDIENTPKEKYPLLLHYHPLNSTATR